MVATATANFAAIAYYGRRLQGVRHCRSAYPRPQPSLIDSDTVTHG